MTSLIPQSSFIGLEEIVHLAAGGESPMLKSHRQAVERFFAHKAQAEHGRHLLDDTYRRCKQKTAQLLGVAEQEIAFLSSASEGINLLAHTLTWEAGDNVVVADVEFPSDILPWTNLEDQGVSVHLVRQQQWQIRLEDIAAAMDDRTRVVAISLVSYFTGQRLPLDELSALVRAQGALLLLDITHAAGVVSVEAAKADIIVTSCYKWLLGVHGVSIFYWNRQRLPHLQPPFLGWHTVESIPSYTSPTAFTLKSDAARFEPGNPSFIGLYILENALDHILEIGIPAISAHVLRLSGLLRDGLQERGYELMTPADPAARAGNVCFTADNVSQVTDELIGQGILIWGSYAGVDRVRASTHLYNTEGDVARLLEALP